MSARSLSTTPGSPFGDRDRIVVSSAQHGASERECLVRRVVGPRTYRLRGFTKIAELPVQCALECRSCCAPLHISAEADRKSTRLNSSHLVTSYAVFCLKKKKQIDHTERLVEVHHDPREEKNRRDHH